MMKKTFFLFFITFIAVISFNLIFSSETAAYDFNVKKKRIIFIDSGLQLEAESDSQTVEDFLNEQKIILGSNDFIFPEKKEKIHSGSRVIIFRAKKIKIKENGKTEEIYTLQNTVQKAIWEKKDIELSDDDITNPLRNVLLKDNMEISVTHVLIKEEIAQEKIDFKTISNEDDELSWRTKKITQKGIKGINEIRYKVIYHDGKEISRKILEKNKIKDPVDEIMTQGTYVKTGKVHTGLGTWYAYKGGLFAASPWLPMGSYAKVTNKENGKSVIVQINDRGPFGENRIIDLDKVAFQKIASLGAGVIDVKVEQILN